MTVLNRMSCVVALPLLGLAGCNALENLARRAVGAPEAPVETTPTESTPREATVTRPDTTTVAEPESALATLQHAELAAHTAEVNGVAFSPDGRLLASASDDGTLRLWDTATLESRTLECGDDFVTAVAFSPDGRWLASGQRTTGITVWELATQRIVRRLDAPAEEITAVTFSPDGERFAAGSVDATVAIFAVSDWTMLRELRVHESSGTVRGLSFSPDSRNVAVASTDQQRNLVVFDAASGESVAELRGHAATVRSVDFAADGTRLVSGGDDGLVRVWDLGTQTVIASFESDSPLLYAVRFHPGGSLVAASGVTPGVSGHRVRLWDLQTGTERIAYDGHSGYVRSLAFSPDGARLASAGDDRVVKLWQVKAASGLVATIATKELPHSVAVSGGLVAAARGGRGPVELWDLGTTDTVAVIDDAMGPVAFSPDGTKLATQGRGDVILLWDRNGEELAQIDVDERFNRLTFVGHDMLAVDVHPTVRLFDVDTGEALGALEADSSSIVALAASADGALLAGAFNPGRVRVWDVRDREVVARIDIRGAQIHAVALSPDGRRVAVGSRDGTVRVHEVHSGAEVANLTHANAVYALIWIGADRLAVGGGSKSIHLWDVAGRRELAVLAGHDVKGVRSLAITADGTLVSGADDRTLRIWSTR